MVSLVPNFCLSCTVSKHILNVNFCCFKRHAAVCLRVKLNLGDMKEVIQIKCCVVLCWDCPAKILCLDRCQLLITWMFNIKEVHGKPKLHLATNLLFGVWPLRTNPRAIPLPMTTMRKSGPGVHVLYFPVLMCCKTATEHLVRRQISPRKNYKIIHLTSSDRLFFLECQL